MGKNKIYAIGKDDKAITLITLIVTIIVLLILAGVATFSGIEAINNTKYTKFKAELKIMQSHVNKWYEQLQPKGEETFEQNIESKFNGVNAINANGNTEDATKAKNTLNIVGISNYLDYYLLKDTQKQQLGIEGVEQDILVSVKDRKVVSYEGFTYKNNTYYTLDDLNEVYNVDYSQQTGKLDFKVKVENLSNGKARIIVYDIEYEGYNNKWKVHYQKDGESTWKTSKDLTFFVEEDGIYTIKLSNQSGDIQGSKTVSVSAFVIKDKNSTLDNSTDKTTMNSKNPVIPKGFRAVDTDTAKWKYTNEERTIVEGWNEGLVIEDDIGNQFVWVPCTMGTSQDVVTYSKKYDYPPASYSASELNSSDTLDTTTVDGKTYSAIPVRENQQIFDYGGFYVARFEAGLPTETLEQSATLNNVYTQIPVSKYGTKVWNYIDYTHSYVAAEKMINNIAKYGYTKSGLITGTQWDTIMQWYEKNSIPVLTSNQDWGTYRNLNYNIDGKYFTNSNVENWINGNNISHTANEELYLYHGSGLNKDGYRKNIADIGGNLWEWTSELIYNNHIDRGGDCRVDTIAMCAAHRNTGHGSGNGGFPIGFRVVLYIQDEPQKRYVTDGLLAYYDAENNTGTGHSFNATTWKDLSGNNNDATLYGFGETADANSGWHSNYLAFDGVDDFASKTGIIVDGANGTIEIVGKYIDSNNNITHCLFRSNASGQRTYIFRATTTKGNPDITCDFNIKNYNDKYQLSSRVLKYYTQNESSYTLNYFNMNKSMEKEFQDITNGNYISIGSFLANNSYYPCKMQVYAVRVYNRALTEDEIRQNYEIDKVRFNIQE